MWQTMMECALSQCHVGFGVNKGKVLLEKAGLMGAVSLL